MTKVKFFADEKGLYGFEIRGHSSKSCDDEIGKIVCAAVSSAACTVFSSGVWAAPDAVGMLSGCSFSGILEASFMLFASRLCCF